MVFKKNDTTEVRIEDFTREGEGIGRVDGYTLFVKDAVIGDRVKALITRPKKHYAYAKCLEVLEPSPDRVEARCPLARRCGGCRFQEYAYPAQLRWKQGYVAETLRRVGGITVAVDGLTPDGAGKGDILTADSCGREKAPDEDIREARPTEVRRVLGMSDPWRYRNKAQYPVGTVRAEDGTRRIAAGYYAGHTHYLIPVEDCLLTHPVSGEVTACVVEHMKAYGIEPYEEGSRTGLVRHILVRRGAASGQVLVCLIINGRTIPGADALVEALRRIEGVTSISLNVNTKPGNTILGEEIIPLYGEPWIMDTLMGLTFRISPQSFYQVNPAQTEVLYGEAIRAAGLTGRETVYDLYCGIGTISLAMARHAREVYGVEIVPQAIRDAKENAQRNSITNAHFYTGAAEELVTRGYFEEGVPCPHPDVVVMDPPRKGCDPALLEAVLALRPERIVYVSCDPATLARDIGILCGGGYRAEYVQPVDMFGHTGHVESCVLLECMDN